MQHITDNYTLLLISDTGKAVFEQMSPWQRDFQAGSVKLKVWRHVLSPLRQRSGCCVCRETYRALTPARAPDQTDSVTQRFPSSCQMGVIRHIQRRSELWQLLGAKKCFLHWTPQICHDDTPCCCEIQRGEICAQATLFYYKWHVAPGYARLSC